MSQWQTAGKVRMTPKGTWNASTAYVVLDCVSNTDKTAYYVAKKDVPAGTLLTNTEYWEVINDISSIANNMNTKIDTLDEIVGLGYPTKEVAGGMTTLENTIEAGLNSFTLYGKSVQSGTPSPDAPVDIVTAGSGGNIKMVSAGKNLIPFTYGTSQTVNGVTFAPNPDGTVNVSGTNTGSGNANFNMFRAAVSGYLPNGTYTVSGFPANGTGLSVCELVVRTNDKSGGNANYISVPASGWAIVCTDISTITSIYISIHPGTAVNAVYTPMLKVGTGAEEYSASVGITAAIPTPSGLPGIPVTSGGNYTDTSGQQWLCDTIDLEAGTYTKRVVSITIPSSSVTYNALESAPLGYAVRYTLPQAADASRREATLCSHFDALDNVAAVNLAAGKLGISNSGATAFFVVDSSITDDATAQAWFAANTVTMVYVLSAPVVEQLTEAQLTAIRSLHSRRGITNIYSADPVFPGFDAELFVNMQSSTVDTLTKMNSPSVSGTGKIVTIDGTIDAPLGKLVIYGKSVQDSTTPTPSAPVSIATAGESGTLPMASAAKNLLRRFINTSGTSDGCTWTYDGDTGTYTLTSTVGSGSSKLIDSGPFNVRNIAGKTLTLSTESITGDSNASVRIFQSNNQLAMIYGTTLSVTFQVPNDDPLEMVIRMGNATVSGVTVVFKGVQLEFGSVRTDFAPMLEKYVSGIPIPNGLPGIPVTSDGNYTDTNGQQWICDTIDLEAGIWTKRCATVAFDGQSKSGWERVNAANSKYRFRNTTLTSEIMKAATNDAVVPLLCTHYTATSANATWTNSDVDGISVDNGGGIFIADAALRDAGTLEQFLARFQNTSMVIVYPLAAPIVTKLTNTQLVALNSLRSHKGQTNLYSTDTAVPELTTKLYIDIPTYINSLVN